MNESDKYDLEEELKKNTVTSNREFTPSAEQIKSQKYIDYVKENLLKNDQLAFLGTIIASVGIRVTIEAILEYNRARTAPDLGEHLMNIQSNYHQPHYKNLAIFTTLQRMFQSPEDLKKALTTLREKNNVQGIKEVLEYLDSPRDWGIILSSANKQERFDNLDFERIRLVYNHLKVLNKEKEQELISNPNSSIAKLLQEHIEILSKEADKYSKQVISEAKTKEEYNKPNSELAKLIAEQEKNRVGIISTHALGNLEPSTTIGSTSPQQSINVTSNSTNALALNNLTTPMQPNASMSNETVINSIIATAMVLRMCGLDKFTKFALPPTPVQVQFDHKLPDNSWTPQEYDQLLKEDPKAQIISNSVKSEMKQAGNKGWTQTDIVNFVNSPKFEEAMKHAQEMEANLRPITAADLGITPTKGKDKNQQSPKKANKSTAKNKESKSHR